MTKPGRALLGVALCLVLLAGCTRDSQAPPSVAPPQEPPSAPVPLPPNTPASPLAPATSPSTSAPPALPVETYRVLAADLDVPWDFALLPDGDALITLREQADVLRLTLGSEPTVVAHLDDVVPEGEGGLLGIALSPDFADDGLVYLYLTAAEDNRVVRYRYDGDTLTSPQLVIDGIPKAGNHNGGRLRFGPDGMLYLGTGDAGERSNSQDTDSLGGKILRLAPDGGIPADNPFGNPVWSYGHRNVQGLGWDAEGHMFASEFGQNALDELNLIEPGNNYGWPIAEGPSGDPDFTDPLLTWPTSEASPSGIAVAPTGVVFIAALRGERIWQTHWTGDGMSDPVVYFEGLGRMRAAELVGGELWVLTNNTARGTPAADDDRLVAIPA